MFANINWIDIVERVVWTAAQAFIATFAAIDFTNLADVQVAATAGIAAAVAAVLSLVKNVIRQNVVT